MYLRGLAGYRPSAPAGLDNAFTCILVLANYDSRGSMICSASMMVGKSLLALSSHEFGRTLCVESFNPFLEIFRLTQPAIAMTLKFDRDRERRIFGIVQKLLRRPLGERGEGAKLVYELVGRFLEFAIGHAFGNDAPIERLFCGDPLRAHHDVLGAGDAD